MESIIKKQGSIPGKHIAIFCGVHGNERAGILAVQKAIQELNIISGSVYFVFANPKAIEEQTRFIEKNLNRCFFPHQKGNLYEEIRARELMSLLDTCDALLDIHASNNPNTTPFVITDNGVDIAKSLNFNIIATGFDYIEPGATDGYMLQKNKIGICIECGYSGESELHQTLAYTSIIHFLQYFKAIEPILPPITTKKRLLHVDTVQLVTSKTFRLTRPFADFETIPANTVIATDASNTYTSDSDNVILFATPDKPIGAEAYILGKWK